MGCFLCCVKMKLIHISVVCILNFMACSSAMAEQKSLAQKVLKPVILHQCQQELAQSKLWHAATLLLAEQKKRHIANQTCECVGEHALNDIKTTDLAKVMISEDTKKQVIQQAIKNSISMCVPKLIS